jgi:hypothetical protein
LELTADNITSEVKGIKNGKNMLSGVLTGTGWKSCASVAANDSNSNPYHDITISSGGNFIRATNDTYLVSPKVSLQKGKKYTLSFVGETTTIYIKNISGSTLTEIHSKVFVGGGLFSTTFTSNNDYNNVRIFFSANLK